ncbi:MAG: hypothetical protein ACYDCK_02240 [Thermoplasmatota archaeon]
MSIVTVCWLAALALAATGIGERSRRALALWLVLRGATSLAAVMFADGPASSEPYWFGLYGYFTLAEAFAFLFFATRFPTRRTWLGTPAGGVALLVAGVALEAVYAVDHCTMFCLQPDATLVVGPLSWAEIGSVLEATFGLALALELRRERYLGERWPLALFASALILFHASKIGLLQLWLDVRFDATKVGYHAASVWIWPLVVVQVLPFFIALAGAAVLLVPRPFHVWKATFLALLGLSMLTGVGSHFTRATGLDATPLAILASLDRAAVAAVAAFVVWRETRALSSSAD